jgi:two-component SAPR family response regulator
MAFRASPTVLIAEDNRLIALCYEDIVTDAGLSVGGSFLSRESAEEWLSVHNPDLAILDIMLQDGNSVELAKKLLELHQRGYRTMAAATSSPSSAPALLHPKLTGV